MTITLETTLIAILASSLVLLIILYFAFRSTRTVYPIRCAHCWIYKSRETVISYSEVPDRWGICPDCIGIYWRFGDGEKKPAPESVNDKHESVVGVQKGTRDHKPRIRNGYQNSVNSRPFRGDRNQ